MKANNLENQIVYLRRPRDEPIKCQVIRAQQDQLEYVNIPEEGEQEITLALKQPGESI